MTGLGVTSGFGGRATSGGVSVEWLWLLAPLFQHWLYLAPGPCWIHQLWGGSSRFFDRRERRGSMARGN